MKNEPNEYGFIVLVSNPPNATYASRNSVQRKLKGLTHRVKGKVYASHGILGETKHIPLAKRVFIIKFEDLSKWKKLFGELLTFRKVILTGSDKKKLYED